MTRSLRSSRTLSGRRHARRRDRCARSRRRAAPSARSRAPARCCIRLEGCGVCASSLPLWEGRPWFEYPQAAGAPGHEGWGASIAVGRRRAPTLAVGDRVAALTYRALRRVRRRRRRARSCRCRRRSTASPFPGEPLGCAINIFRRSGIEAGQTVAIVGIGFLGALAHPARSARRRAGDRDLAPAVRARGRAAVRRRRDDPDGRPLAHHRAGRSD